MTRILVISDIHGNYPALRAVADQVDISSCDIILNCGDSTVYAPFANQALDWLTRHNALSILGNTDGKVIKLLKGKSFKKPGKAEKRIMYEHTAETLTKQNQVVLTGLKKKKKLLVENQHIHIFHGSPEHPNEFLFPDTPEKRFRQLALNSKADIIITGHSHIPYHKFIARTHFINPGSVGRMFDGIPKGSYAILELDNKKIQVNHYRCNYDIEEVVAGLQKAALPSIYAAMYRRGEKLN